MILIGIQTPKKIINEKRKSVDKLIRGIGTFHSKNDAKDMKVMAYEVNQML